MLKQNRISRIIGSEQGAVLVISLVILVVLTIIGIAANRTSVLDILISNAGKQKQGSFYAAEAGLEHAKAVLSDKLTAKKAADPDTNNWTFILNGSEDKPEGGGKLNAATGRDVDTGVKFFESKALSGGNYTYDVFLWDNFDGDNDDDADLDRMVILHSVGRGKLNGGYTALQTAIDIGVGTITLSRYIQEQTAQKYGTTKGSSNKDIGAVEVRDDAGNTQYQVKYGAGVP